MFREIRRKNQILTAEECIRILEAASSGVLAVLGDEDYPYAVPLSYVYGDGKIYFHCAVSGHKLDAVRQHDKVSFCVIYQDQIVPEKYTTYFQSVIVFGRMRILQDEKEKRNAIEKLSLKYAPCDSVQSRNQEIDRYWNALCMMELEIEHMSGKEGRELALAKRKE